MYFMKYSYLRYILVLTFSMILGEIQAQKLNFEKITTKNGLSSNNVLGITKDPQGYLWLATNLGISRYDGYQFQSFGNLSSPNGIAISTNGILWFSNEKGLYSLDTKSLSLSLKIANKVNDNIPDNDHYNSIFVDSKGLVWSTDFHHIKSYNPQKNLLTYYKILNENQQNPNLAKFAEDTSGNLWSVSPIGLCKFDRNRQTWMRVLSEKNLTALAFDEKNGTFWVGNQQGNLINFNPKTKVSTTKANIGEAIEDIQFLSNQSILCVSHNHLFQLTISQTKLEEIGQFMADDISLNTIFIDPQKNELWLGTNEGLLKQETENQLIRQVLISRNIIPNPANVRCFEAENQQTYLLGTSSGEVLRWNKLSNEFQKITQVASEEIRSIKVLDNKIFIGTNKSLFVKKQGANLEKILSKPINHIELDGENRLWILLPNEPIIVYDFKKNQFVQPWSELPYSNFFKDNLFHKITYTTDQKMWIAGWIPSGFGIACFDFRTNQFQELSSINDHKSFISDYYLDVSATPKGDLLFSGYGGYNRLNAKGIITEEVHAEDLKPLFADGQCFSIDEDSKGNTWIGTAEGLVKISKDKQVNRFTQFDGLLSNDIRNGFLMTNNELLLGHKNGFSIINLSNIGLKNQSHRLMLSQINILGSDQIVDLSKNLVFSRKQNNLSFSFSPLNFENQARNKFRYRLTEINEKWIENGVNPTITFSNLEQGSYQLEVQYAEIAGNWNTDSLILNFEILPAWYERLWFKVLLASLLLAIGYGIYRCTESMSLKSTVHTKPNIF